jgi:hypothetical protein
MSTESREGTAPMSNYDRAMSLVEKRLAAYDRVWELALSEPEGKHRPNGAYIAGWDAAMAAVIEALRG